MSITREAMLSADVEINAKRGWESGFVAEISETMDEEEWEDQTSGITSYADAEKLSCDIDQYCENLEEEFLSRNYFSVYFTLLFKGDDGEFYSVKEFKDPTVDTGDLFSTKKGGV